MDAAQICFAAHGYRETSNRMVADVADITSGAIYHYFTSKQDLFLSAHDDIQKQIFASLEDVIATGSTFSESVDKVLRLLLGIAIDHPTWVRFNAAVRTEARRNPEISTAQDDTAWRTLFRRLADVGVASGEIDPQNWRAVQAVLAATVHGLSQHGIEAKVATHVECVRGFSLLLRGLLVTPRDSSATAVRASSVDRDVTIRA